jgi:ribonuclease BN (tRNA processing enzyme)
MDGQFSRRTYPAHAGWGHSTWEECVALARATGVRRLIVTHHAPGRTDRDLARLARTLARAWPGASLARAGQCVAIPA